MAGTNFSHLPTQTSHEVLQETCRQNGWAIVAQRISEESRMIGLLISNGFYLPVYPRSPLLGLRHITSDEWRGLYQKPITDIVGFLLTLEGYRAIPKYICQRGGGFQGIVTLNGFFIPTAGVTTSLEELRETTGVSFETIDYPIEELNNLLGEKYSPQYLVTDYATPRKASWVLQKLDSLSSKQDIFKPVAYVNSKTLSGIILSSGLLISTQPIPLISGITLPNASQELDGWQIGSFKNQVRVT